MPDVVYAGLGNTFVIVFGAPVDEDAARVQICERARRRRRDHGRAGRPTAPTSR